MVTLYIHGSAESQDGISYDYISVPEEMVDALMAAGWVKNISDLQSV